MRWRPASLEDEEEQGRKILTKIRRCRAHTSPMAPFCAGPHTTSTVGCFRGSDGSGKACGDKGMWHGAPLVGQLVLGTWQRDVLLEGSRVWGG